MTRSLSGSFVPGSKIAEPVRARDTINTGPRFSEADAVRLNRMFRGADTVEMLRSVITDGLAGDIAVVSSMGAESAVLLHLVAQIDPTLPVLFLDTGKHFDETLAYRDELVKRLGLTGLRILTPDAATLADRDESGLRWSYDPDGCCEIRKVQPLAAALAEFDASLTGRKAFQSSTRSSLPRFEVDNSDAQGRLKINPLIDWKADDIAAYFAEHDLPPHPLVADGYPSIGCSPCTSKVAAGEDSRSGRWKGWDKTECGIHSPVQPGPDGELPPGFDPVF
ncbi:MAG: phosphoadenylyl-sulfate reductase [Sphingomonadaceae bacterium]